jgi:hypothetical protein
VTEPALSLHFFDPEHGIHGSARSGATLLFEGAGSAVLPEGPRIERSSRGWRAELDGAFALELEPLSAAAEIDGMTAHVCAVDGEVEGGRRVRCLGTVAETHSPPAWDELDALRSISALFDREHAFLAVGRRPRGAIGHGDERIAAWLLSGGEPVAIEDARISTVYDGEGRQRSAGLELWVPGEDLPLRGSGTVVAGSSLALEGVDVHVAIFRWRMDDREGAGSYELMSRSEPQAA